MSGDDAQGPEGASITEGIVHRRSRHALEETLARLRRIIEGAGARIFLELHQDAEAASVGLALRPTVLVLFGNPLAGTQIMQVNPGAALDLPLRVLLWSDDDEVVWASYLAPSWLADRHGLATDVATPLYAVEAIVSATIAD